MAESLIEYGVKTQYGYVPKSEKEMLKKKNQNPEEQDPLSLKSYLDTILPPKESTENGQIYMQFVSCTSATTNDVVKLSNKLDNQMKSSGARETGICNQREELYSQCLDELIRQITINCIQRGELQYHIKEQMKETINYYQKLYESSMSFAMRKVLREQKKKMKLEQREKELLKEISDLKNYIEEKKKKNDEEENDFKDKIATLKLEHEETVKNMKDSIESKKKRVKEILTTPKMMPNVKK